MSQRGLIKKLLTTAGMEDCHPVGTPAVARPLSSDEEGAPFAESWSY